MTVKSTIHAYIIGIALGDGNLSNPNGRATRLRITCDIAYPNIIKQIIHSLEEAFPNNQVSTVTNKNGNCIDISVYSNTLNDIIPWAVGKGSKYTQQAHVPKWILQKKIYTISCLRGLLQTDGSIYKDRKYTMVNFTNLTKPLIDDVYNMMTSLGYEPHVYDSKQKNGNIKYVVRLSKNVTEFIQEIKLIKA